MKAVHRRATRLALVACGVIVCAIGATAQKGRTHGSGGSSDTPVTSALPGLTSSYSIRGDSDPPVPYGSDVKSIIQTRDTCCRDWELDTAGSTRSITLDFNEWIAGSAAGGDDPSPPFWTGAVEGRMLVQCHLVQLAGYDSFLTMYAGEQRFCPAIVTFPAGGSGPPSKEQWTLAIEYGRNFSAHVTCLNVSNLVCDRWQVDSSQSDGSPTTRAKLWRQSWKGNTVNEDHGDFLLTFLITVTNP